MEETFQAFSPGAPALFASAHSVSAIFYGYPLWYSIQISLENYDLQAEITGVASFIGFSNYLADFHDPTFQAAALHTLLFTVLSIIPQFLLGLALALFFYRRFPLSRVARLLFAPLAVAIDCLWYHLEVVV